MTGLLVLFSVAACCAAFVTWEAIDAHLLERRAQRATGVAGALLPRTTGPRAWAARLRARRASRRARHLHSGAGLPPLPVRVRNARLGADVSVTPSLDCTRGEDYYRQQRDAFIRGLAASGHHVDELHIERISPREPRR